MDESINTVNTSSILTPDRIRADQGTKEEWATFLASIKEWGLIEPIVLCQVDGHVQLNAGGRRLAALKELGIDELQYGRHFIWLADANNDPYRRKSVELEENLRRKDLTWQEQVLGKQQLLSIMQKVHGPAQMGRGQTGFGVNKLAALLGETTAATSKDLKIANMVRVIPALAGEVSKAAVERKFAVLKTILKLHVAGKSIDEAMESTEPVARYAVIVECNDEAHQLLLLARFVLEGLRCKALIS